MGQSSRKPFQENLETLHAQFMKQGGIDLDICTATTLTYNQFIKYITKINEICTDYKDSEGKVLVFAVKKNTDCSFFWKATVRIACVKLNSITNDVESCRFLNIRQFLQVFRRIFYECTGGSFGSQKASAVESSTPVEGPQTVPPTLAASMVLGEALASFSDQVAGHHDTSDSLEECIICLERKPEVILPCAHAYCVPCIEQWWEYSAPCEEECSDVRRLFGHVSSLDKTCPVCRESLESVDDTWVISEAPEEMGLNESIMKNIAKVTSSGDLSYTIEK